jgi:hypothetical protein
MCVCVCVRVYCILNTLYPWACDVNLLKTQNMFSFSLFLHRDRICSKKIKDTEHVLFLTVST